MKNFTLDRERFSFEKDQTQDVPRGAKERLITRKKRKESVFTRDSTRERVNHVSNYY